MIAVSSVSATDSDAAASDDLAIDAVDDNISLEDTGGDNVALEENSDDVISDVESQEAAASDESAADDVLKLDGSQENLSTSSPDYYDYDVQFASSSYQFPPGGGTYVDFYIDPCDYSGYYAYDFKLKIYDSNGYQVSFKDADGNLKDYKNLYSTSSAYYVDYYIGGLSQGTYTMKAINYEDDYVLDTATLIVKGQDIPAVISTSVPSQAYYLSKKTFTVWVKSQQNNNPLRVGVKVVFKKGSTTITKIVGTDSSGKASFVLPDGLTVGTWQITTTVGTVGYPATAKVNTIKIVKSPVKVTTKKVTQYQGIYFYLKAYVKSQDGKNVNEGKVQFKINGKIYKVAVKNGVASKKLKLNKVKKYNFYTKYLGTTNLKIKSAAKNKVVIKERFATKLTFKNVKGKSGDVKYFTVKVTTKKGNKNVKGGYVIITNKETGSWTYSYVSNGKAKFKYTFGSNYNGYYGDVSYYSKKVINKYTVKYSPTSYKYKCSSKTLKVTTLYKCSLCGKTKSHSHGSGYYRWYISVN
jgi:hypothetical protein